MLLALVCLIIQEDNNNLYDLIDIMLVGWFVTWLLLSVTTPPPDCLSHPHWVSISFVCLGLSCVQFYRWVSEDVLQLYVAMVTYAVLTRSYFEPLMKLISKSDSMCVLSPGCLMFKPHDYYYKISNKILCHLFSSLAVPLMVVNILVIIYELILGWQLLSTIVQIYYSIYRLYTNFSLNQLCTQGMWLELLMFLHMHFKLH